MCQNCRFREPSLRRDDIILDSTVAFRLRTVSGKSTDPSTQLDRKTVLISIVTSLQKTLKMSNLSTQLRYDGKVVIVTGAGGITAAVPGLRNVLMIRRSGKGLCTVLCVERS